MWKDYFKGILNSENSANGSAESVEHSIDCEENYLGVFFCLLGITSSKAALEQSSRA